MRTELATLSTCTSLLLSVDFGAKELFDDSCSVSGFFPLVPVR